MNDYIFRDCPVGDIIWVEKEYEIIMNVPSGTKPDTSNRQLMERIMVFAGIAIEKPDKKNL